MADRSAGGDVARSGCERLDSAARRNSAAVSWMPVTRSSPPLRISSARSRRRAVAAPPQNRDEVLPSPGGPSSRVVKIPRSCPGPPRQESPQPPEAPRRPHLAAPGGWSGARGARRPARQQRRPLPSQRGSWRDRRWSQRWSPRARTAPAGLFAHSGSSRPAHRHPQSRARHWADAATAIQVLVEARVPTTISGIPASAVTK